MKINSVSFKGNYKEEINTKYVDRVVAKELKRAKPFLKLLARSMPYDNDIFVRVENDPCDTILTVDCVNKKKNKTFNLAKGNEHTLTGTGCYIIEDTFKGLEKYDKKAFDIATKSFVKNITWLENTFKPYKPANFDNKFICLDCGCIIERHNK